MKLRPRGGGRLNFAKQIIFLFVIVALAGCASKSFDQPIKVEAHTDPDADFSGYKTWNFVDYQNKPDMGVLEDAELRLQLGNAIEKALTERGLTRVFESPDLDFGFHAARESIDEEQLKKWYDTQAWDLPSYQGGLSDQWQAGTLLLFLFDAKSGQMLWRSSAEAFVDKDTPEKDRKMIVERAVQLMLDKMPKQNTQ